ncbi:MAG: 2-oxo-4-hydroxy-4-carboxy-5-ureidoimidazoline decarboxylase [Chthoniobacterales bacterium]
MLNVSDLNVLDRDQFVRVIGPVFEHSPWIAERGFAQRPFDNRDELHRALCYVVRGSTTDEKLSLIRAHPDLVAKTVLTSESQREQRSAGLSDLTEAERDQFREYNNSYYARFDFPFVICARVNKKEAILRAFPQRLQNAPEIEMETALEEIYKIADLRLQDLVQ